MAKSDPLTSALLNRIRESYLNSFDFNGIALIDLVGEDRAKLETLKNLVRKELVEVYSAAYDNPHIKRLPPLSVSRQVDFLDQPIDPNHVCIYPSIRYMRRVRLGRAYRNRAFTRLLALGHPQLTPVFFHLNVLERYQSDPRYVFAFDGLDGHISIGDKAYKSREMGKADKVMLETFGLGSNAKGHRVAISFLRYLSTLSARHQQHWHTHRLHGDYKIEQNYRLRGIWGMWTDGVSIYDALLEEICHINRMCSLIGLPRLFRREYGNGSRSFESNVPLDEPKGFGLLMRPTRKAFLEFAQVLDKLISENINIQYFVAEGLRVDEQISRNSQPTISPKGTLRLLEEWLAKRIRIQGENGPAIILAPLKKVRKLRQSPAHEFVSDEFSLEYQKKKEKLISDVYVSISNIRMFFQTHPRASEYKIPKHLKPENLVIF